MTVLERRGVVGGAAVTEEFHPGFRNSVASYTVSLLNPKIIADMDLPGHGLRVVERKLQNFLPLNDREYLETGGERTKESVAKFSKGDAAMLEPYGARLGEIADVVRDLMLKTPPNVTEGGWFSAIPEMLKAAGQASPFASLSMPARRDLLALFAQSAGGLSRRLVRERADQGGLRFRRRGRQLREPLYARFRLRPAASRAGRSERQERRLGTRHRRHGLHHAGNGEGVHRSRRHHQDRCTGQGNHHRERPRSRRRDRIR